MTHDHGRAVLGLTLPRATWISSRRSASSAASSGSPSPEDMERCASSSSTSRVLRRDFASEAQTGVDRDPVEPGRKGAVSPEALHVRPDPDPDLLARVLGLLAPSMRSVTPRTRAEWALTSFENASTSPREAREIRALGCSSRFSVEAFRSRNAEPGSRTTLASYRIDHHFSSKIRSRQVSIALHGLQYLTQQPTGEFFAARIHYPVDPASFRYRCAPHPRTDYIRLELRIIAVVAGEMVQQRAHRAVERTGPEPCVPPFSF